MGSLKATSPRAELVRLERQLHQTDVQLTTLQREREQLVARLQAARRALTICPKCGRDEDFLTDEGGVLIHVLEDSDDTELLSPNKALYCPSCGEVFLYQPAPLGAGKTRPEPRIGLLRSRTR